jgi:hypothetical protein
MDKNRIRGAGDQGEWALDREALVTKGTRRKSGGRAEKVSVLTWGDLASDPPSEIVLPGGHSSLVVTRPFYNELRGFFEQGSSGPDAPTRVTQAFCSAISCGYTTIALEHWEPLATLVLDAAYEATLRAAVLDTAAGHGSGRVWLTFLGGGAFGNRKEWIGRAIGRALARLEGVQLDVHIGHYRTLDEPMIRMVDESRARHHAGA